MIHFGSNMAPKEDDVSRLKILLSEGHSLTDAAKIMEVSRSTAQRLKKKIKDSSPAENQKLDLVYGILENATTLLLTGQSMKQALDWSKTIYWNYHYICQERGQHWIKYDLGSRMQNKLGFGEKRKKRIKAFMFFHLEELLELPDIDGGSYYKVTKYIDSWERYGWMEKITQIYADRHNEISRRGDLAERMEKFAPNSDKIYQDLVHFSSKYPIIQDLILGVALVYLKMQYKFDIKEKFNQLVGDDNLFTTITWIECTKLNDSEYENLPSPEQFAQEFYQQGVPDEQILKDYTDFSDDVINYMCTHEKYVSTDVELVIFGGVEEIDLEFAKRGKFRNGAEVRKARELACTNRNELENVVEHGWLSGEELRQAMANYEVAADNRQLWLNMAEMNPQVNWTGEWKSDLLAWADCADQDDFNRLQGFPHPKAMMFFDDVLMTFDEASVRTDYLLKYYNEVNAPGDFISEEQQFSELMSQPCFGNIVKVGKGGVSSIDFALRSTEFESWQPKSKINVLEFTNLHKSRKKAAKDLHFNLSRNILDKSLTGSYDWLASNLRTKLGIGKKDEFLVIDELTKLLNLDRQSINSLHQARMARNWVAHPFEAEEVEPTWEMVKLCLNTAELVVNLGD